MNKDDKNLVDRYFKKASKQAELTELTRVSDSTFTFKFADEYFTVAFSEDDITMIIAEGLGDPFTNDSAHELGIYEIEELSF